MPEISVLGRRHAPDRAARWRIAPEVRERALARALKPRGRGGGGGGARAPPPRRTSATSARSRGNIWPRSTAACSTRATGSAASFARATRSPICSKAARADRAHEILPSAAEVDAFAGDAGTVFAKVVHSPARRCRAYPAIGPAFSAARARCRGLIERTVKEAAAGAV